MAAAGLKKTRNVQYVLDTNVLLHDPTSIYRFQEHDVHLPLVVLEELDRHKKGTSDLARAARQVTRELSHLLQTGFWSRGLPLEPASRGMATGKIYFHALPEEQVPGLDASVPDNQILACVRHLYQSNKQTVLVTKDINLRVKALALHLPAEDYHNDQVMKDTDILPSGFIRIDEAYWEKHQPTPNYRFWHRQGRQYVSVAEQLPLNSFLIEYTADSRTRTWRVEQSAPGESILYSVTGKEAKGGILEARNEEQVLAQTLLRDEQLDCVSLLGPAGTGKTLLAIAAGLEQISGGIYDSMLVTRATIPLGDDIGFLPGTEEEKMGAWIGGTLRDVYSVLKLDDPKSPLRQKVEIASMSFMRGRSFQGKFIVIDEAQNLTVRQMRALLTRAGQGSKVVLTGNLAQIDSPYLNEGSSGLAWAVKTLQGWPHAGHLVLTIGERSRLASYVEDAAELHG